MPVSGAEWAYLQDIGQRLADAGYGRRQAVVDAACEALGISMQTLYRKLKAAGFETGRKRRGDAGQQSLSRDELRTLSGMLYHGKRENAKEMLPIKAAISIAHASGELEARLSASQVNKLLRKNHLHPKQLAQQAAAVSLQSLHPNHVWQIDASVCVLYYLRDGSLETMDRDEFYRNKPQNFARVANDLCTRYAVVDHYSGAFKVRYYTGGETGVNLVEFFLYAVDKQAASPMHGVPSIVMLDPGAANKGHLFTNLAKQASMRVVINRKGNARAKGSVEKAHDIIERNFEGRFRFMESRELTLEGINEQVQTWTNYYCAHEPHSRHGKTRFGMWMSITEVQLRVPKSIAVLRELATTPPEQRRVDNTRCITVKVGRERFTYDLSRIEHAGVGERVTVVVNVFRSPAIDVLCIDEQTGDESWQTVEPLTFTAAGFRTDAPVIGDQIRTARQTPADRERNGITLDAYRLEGQGLPTLEEAQQARKRHEPAYAGRIDAMADIAQTPQPSFLPRSAEVLALPGRNVELPKLNVVQACRRVKEVLGDRYPADMFTFVQERFPDGVPEAQVSGLPALYATVRGIAADDSTNQSAAGGQ